MQPTADDFFSRHRGGGLFTMTVSQRVGARLGVVAFRLGLAPTVLTIGNLMIGLGTSLVVMGVVPRRPDMHLAVGIGALVFWQLAYALDCADGQLARVTARASAAGRRIDILCDVATQIVLVASVVTVATAFTDDLPSWLAALFAGTWMVNLVTSVLQQDGATAYSLVTSGSRLVQLIKLVRDYGAVVSVIGLTLAFAPHWMVWVLVVFTVVNGGFLLASIAATARTSLGQS
jgi:phosphatidylglycerophosphate synthase